MVQVQNFYSANELSQLGLKSLPTSHRRILDKAKRENWKCQKRQGRGGGVEYEVASLPAEVQQELLLKTAPQQTAVALQNIEQTRPLASPELWQMWDRASAKAQEQAKIKLGTMFAVASLVETGVNVLVAFEAVCGKENAERRQNGEKLLSVGTLKNWWYRIKDAPRQDWLPLMLNNTGKASKNVAEMDEKAWEFFKNFYYCREKPSLAHSYEVLKDAAKFNGWAIPSRSSLQRKMAREVPKTEEIYRREGQYALSRLYPSQVRTVAMLQAMEWINGDGYQHNVWVQFPDGEIKRPKTWLWQDVRTRKVLAARTDKSENTDTIRLSLLDVISRYGLPKHLTIDNTRAAANKKMTGGVKNRYRYTVNEGEVQGIIPALGIELHWTSIQFGKGRGQAKPIERAFSHGGLGDYVDKHLLLRGAYAGANAYEKPDYDGKSGAEQPVDYATFLMALEQGIQQWNSVEKRLTEICAGQMSYNQAFERDWAVAEKRPVRESQMRLLLTLHEEVRLNQDGTFHLNVGKIGTNKNRYESLELIGSMHKRVVVRYDPANLHGQVWVYALTGEYLAEAQITEKAGFGDQMAGREYNKALRNWTKHQEKAIKERAKAEKMELANYTPSVEFEDDFLAVIPDLKPQPTPKVEVEYEEVIEHNTIRIVEKEAIANKIEEELSVFDIALEKQNKLSVIKQK
ncbi:transposase domain-containing protein [Actinobacillus pleuropneumoniae]|uniref:transposase domain-containing protein n=1 Tax=Actinobacillus pleuropneumoniae TaxID=715 RepID=UPI00351152FA